MKSAIANGSEKRGSVPGPGLITWFLRRRFMTVLWITLLGTIGALAESAGISLFLPLMNRVSGGSSAAEMSRFGKFLAGLSERFPAQNTVLWIVAAMISLIFMKSVVLTAYGYLSARLTAYTGETLRSLVFSRLIHDPGKALDTAESSRIFNLLVTDSWKAADALSHVLGIVIYTCTALVFGCLLLAISWQLTVIMAIAVGAVSFLLRIPNSSALKHGEVALAANSRMTGQVMEALGNLRTIQLYALERSRRNSFEHWSKAVSAANFRIDMLYRLVQPLGEFLYAIVLTAALLLSGGRGGFASAVVFMVILYRLQPQLKQIDSSRSTLHSLQPCLEELWSFTAPELSVVRVPAKAHVPLSDPLVNVQRVSFAYCESQFAIEEVSFRIPRGAVTALAGSSGAGKSTLVDLLCGLIFPGSGSIRLGEQELTSENAPAWRAQIGMAGQNTQLFTDTIESNIRNGKLDASAAEIREASIVAAADDFVEALPEAYQTIVGPGGLSLSDGQRQRILLARALIRRPALLILDEASNAIDATTESIIFDSIRRFIPGCTVLIVSHRLSSIQHADHVVVIDQGRVIEEGAPEHLAEAQGSFAGFVRAQKLSRFAGIS